MMYTFLKWIGISLVGLGAIAVLIVLVQMRLPLKYELPEGYRGWVVLKERPECPTLERKGIYIVIPIPVSGIACTSTPRLLGWRYTRFEYVGADGRRTNIDLASGIWGHAYAYGQLAEFFFVGRKEEMKSGPPKWLEGTELVP